MKDKTPLRTIKIRQLECFRCGFRWFPRPNHDTGIIMIPLKCANKNCSRYDWNIDTVRTYNKKVIN